LVAYDVVRVLTRRYSKLNITSVNTIAAIDVDNLIEAVGLVACSRKVWIIETIKSIELFCAVDASRTCVESEGIGIAVLGEDLVGEWPSGHEGIVGLSESSPLCGDEVSLTNELAARAAVLVVAQSAGLFVVGNPG
jgi:hypothetical protein